MTKIFSVEEHRSYSITIEIQPKLCNPAMNLNLLLFNKRIFRWFFNRIFHCCTSLLLHKCKTWSFTMIRRHNVIAGFLWCVYFVIGAGGISFNLLYLLNFLKCVWKNFIVFYDKLFCIISVCNDLTIMCLKYLIKLQYNDLQTIIQSQIFSWPRTKCQKMSLLCHFLLHRYFNNG